MVTSVYAHGSASIEVGKFGGSPEAARAWFAGVCEANGATATSRTQRDGVLVADVDDDTMNVLVAVARIADLHGDPPDIYTFESDADVADGEYIKTGSYND